MDLEFVDLIKFFLFECILNLVSMREQLVLLHFHDQLLYGELETEMFVKSLVCGEAVML